MAELIVTSSLEQIDKYKFCNSEQLRSIIKGINKTKLTGEIIFPKKNGSGGVRGAPIAHAGNLDS